MQTGSYTYSGNTEATSTYVWYRANDISGTSQAAISGATSITYTLQAADINKHVAFEVTPIDIYGEVGTTVRSDYRASVSSSATTYDLYVDRMTTDGYTLDTNSCVIAAINAL